MKVLPFNRPPGRVLGIWAHPDDEAYCSAGFMAQVTDAGGRVTVVTATDGEAGFAESDPRSSAERAFLRRRELQDAMATAGVTDLRFMGWPDGGVAHIPDAVAVNRFAAIILEVRPDVIVTFGPDGVTGHSDHVAVSRFVSAAWRLAGISQLLYAANTLEWLDDFRHLHEPLGVWMTREPDPTPNSDLFLNLVLSDVEVDRKRLVLAGHSSQTTGISEAMGEVTYRSWVRQEAFRLPTARDFAGFFSDRVESNAGLLLAS